MVAEPIAILGTGCRFPGECSSPSRLWDLLKNPRVVASKPPSTRFDIDAFYHEDATYPGTANAREAYFLSEDPRRFDAPFFNTSFTEAESIDPQQRMLLETVFEAVEAAGLRIDRLQGSSTGMFCGVMGGDWGDLLSTDYKAIPQHLATSVARSNLANRVSYLFDWHGPSMVVDTACSSSMVALHQAVMALQHRDCSISVAAGSNLLLSPNLFITTTKLQMLSPNGRGRMWDAAADGYARGEGVAAVVLKRLSDAVADGDPIECVIRATGVNQDGRTTGLTMPSSLAQLQLIESTYSRAGLNPRNPTDRCQYFEAHGTGTVAGDPQEASAIHQAFFGQPASSPGPADDEDHLYVGSIKTIVGHTEGTAGLAGLIKASLSLQRGYITPNLLFERLHPALESFGSRLRVPTELVPWPPVEPGQPRRVSVNSFGFGGTNAHAILESYEPEGLASWERKQTSLPPILPFVFSAATGKSLGDVLDRFAEYLEKHSNVDPTNLADTLLERRSALKYRLAFQAPNLEGLLSSIRTELDTINENKTVRFSCQRSTGPQRRILGVFTGQGAQWSRMGSHLISNSPEVRKWLQEMQDSLEQLPEKYRPSFTLIDKFLDASADLNKASLSQPLCTALQIVLVRLLSTLGVSFSVVVGHSSGEIGAAYAAGFLSAADAIRIAYLRGFFAPYAGAANGQPGAMLAAGLSSNEAAELCSQEEFRGRVALAASNGPGSVTLSGDSDAITQVEAMLKEDNIFVRRLRVDTAYHSHHMHSCSEAYLQALRGCDVQIQQTSGVQWYSSVSPGVAVNLPEYSSRLKADYWNENMISPVLFSQAMSTALAAGEPDLVVEVGPHPALKGPAQQIICETLSNGPDVPIIALSNRGMDGIEAMASAVGSMWAYLGPGALDIPNYIRLFDKNKTPRPIRNLPLYPFDHSKVHSWETRMLNEHLHKRGAPHPLLGSLETTNADAEWRWRHYIRREDLEWLEGHRIQSQTVFPATGYLAMAIEAVRMLASGRAMRLLQLHGFTIHQAIVLPDDDPRGVETLFRLNIQESDDVTTGNFDVHAATGGNFQVRASGQFSVTWGEPCKGLLPPLSAVPGGMAPVDIGLFYEFLRRMGYGYSGLFERVHSLSRKKDLSRGEVQNISLEDKYFHLSPHPAVLDATLQTMLGALGAPDDGELYTLMVPTSIRSITINPAFCGPPGLKSAGSLLVSDAAVAKLDADGIAGDVDLFTEDGQGIIQLEGVEIFPLFQPGEDRQIFSQLAWGPLSPHPSWQTYSNSTDFTTHAVMMEKISLISMKLTHAQITDRDREGMDWHRSKVMSWMDHVLTLTEEGRHPICPKEWLSGTQAEVADMSRQLSGSVTAEMAGVVFANMLDFLRGKTSLLEAVRKNDVLTRFYKDDMETKVMNERLGDLVSQITFRYPRMKFLEIGAGTASATRAVIDSIGRSYHSYTFTDISVGFFEEAQAIFKDHGDRFIYQPLDIERDPGQQGFKDHAYDLIIASNVLHATKSMQHTMTHVRRLLKPGGFLILLEVTNTETIRTTFLVSGFEGWWAGHEDGRIWGPMLSVPGWDDVLRRTGFGGVDTHIMLGDPKYSVNSVMISQAVDDRIQLLRNPLQPPPGITLPPPKDLVILGGSTNWTANLVASLREMLAPHFNHITHARAPELLDQGSSAEATTVVLSMADLDWPCFEDLTDDRVCAMQSLVATTDKMLWVTIGPEHECPYYGMSKGWLRSLAHEHKECLYQYFNIEDKHSATPSELATVLMRLLYTDTTNDYTLSTYVHSTEPEIYLKDGFMQICRLHYSSPMNERYIASRRHLYRTVDLKTSEIRAEPSPAGNKHRLHIKGRSCRDTVDCVRVRVRYSTALALQVDNGFVHVLVGEQEGTVARLLAFSEQHASVVDVPVSWTCPVPSTVIAGYEAAFLEAVVDVIIARGLVQMAAPQSCILIHDAHCTLRDTIVQQAVSKGLRTYFTTSNESAPGESVFLPPRMSTRALKGLIPTNVTVAACFHEENKVDSVFSRIATLLPRTVVRTSLGDFYHRSPHIPVRKGNRHSGPAIATLQSACTLAAQLGNNRARIMPIRIENLSTEPVEPYRFVDWTQSTSVPVQIEPISSLVAFHPRKTYLLAGMAGDLGQLLAGWMVSKGARHIVLTSRNPKVDPKWMESMAKHDAQIVPLAMDLSNRESVRGAYRTIQRDLPPIGGVANGALVLSDCEFMQATVDIMQENFGPKVQGSLFLHELSGPNVDLEFFILFGSMTGIIGNWSQSAYSAATGFQASLIHQRRATGLVGSIIHPGVISGVGYIARKGSSLAQHVRNTTGSFLLSERDVEKLFAEAILAGHPQSGHDPELITGTPPINPDDHPDIVWYQNPMTWEFVDYCQRSKLKQTGGLGFSSIRTELQAAVDMHEVSAILMAGLTAKVRSKFNLAPDMPLAPSTQLRDLGMDSLVAVDLRTWFAKELAVEIPLLQILNGGSIRELASEALGKLPASLIPHLAPRDGTKEFESRRSGSPVDVPSGMSGTTESLAGDSESGGLSGGAESDKFR
ncbi:non-reducing polyketide synthase pyr2 [Aspergillus foveolatus]|uniref:non-reducing polyketide synthase pyr2 n=1 Tax=Aspergillus foveolatus TaxID=210207 RepID=UPI003CCE1370